MTDRLSALLAFSVLAAACGGGPPGPPALAYHGSRLHELSYLYGDTTAVTISLMGQRMELSQRGVAEYAVTFDPTPGGLSVRLVVAALAGAINQPMGAPIRLDESDVSGDLVFTLDRYGDAVVLESPVVSDVASQMVSGLSLAHSFFPGLPGRPVAMGASWIDTVSYEGQEGPGMRSERTVLEYTVVGDTTVADRALLLISLEGTTEASTEMAIGGMAVAQTSNLEVTGHILWDLQRGLMFESYRTSRGTGSVRVPIAPGPLPIEVEMTRRARLEGI